MKKIISTTITNKLKKLDQLIKETPNTVPNVYSHTFNFKGRKSPLVAHAVIKELLNKNESFYDPFAGSGSFLLAGADISNHIYATELDNYAYFAFNSLIAASISD